MKPLLGYLPRVALALALAVPLSLPALAQDSDCLTDRQAQVLVERGEILDVPGALARAGRLDARPIGQARLCERDGVPHWIVNVMNPYGDSERVVLKALANSQ